MSPALQNRDLLKIGRLAALTGVAVATIKFYIREGLLPRPTVKTSRNMAYYDRSFVDRIRIIKRLQERYLPLRVIKQLLAERERFSTAEAETLADLGPAIAAVLVAPGGEPASERAVRRRFPEASRERLALLSDLGLLRPRVRGRARFYDADDVRLLEALHHAHEAGFSPDRFPIEDLGHYVELIGELAEREVRFFTKHVTAKLAALEAHRLVGHALEASEPVVLLVRRKLLHAALEKYLADT